MATDAQRRLLDRRAPEFKMRADRTDYLDDAALQVSAARFGTSYNLAVVLLAAHSLELRRRVESGLAGASAIVSQTPGGAVSFASGAPGFYSLTVYGLEYEQLRRRRHVGPIVLNGSNSVSGQ